MLSPSDVPNTTSINGHYSSDDNNNHVTTTSSGSIRVRDKRLWKPFWFGHEQLSHCKTATPDKENISVAQEKRISCNGHSIQDKYVPQGIAGDSTQHKCGSGRIAVDPLPDEYSAPDKLRVDAVYGTGSGYNGLELYHRESEDGSLEDEEEEDDYEDEEVDDEEVEEEGEVTDDDEVIVCEEYILDSNGQGHWVTKTPDSPSKIQFTTEKENTVPQISEAIHAVELNKHSYMVRNLEDSPCKGNVATEEDEVALEDLHAVDESMKEEEELVIWEDFVDDRNDQLCVLNEDSEQQEEDEDEVVVLDDFLQESERTIVPNNEKEKPPCNPPVTRPTLLQWGTIATSSSKSIIADTVSQQDNTISTPDTTSQEDNIISTPDTTSQEDNTVSTPINTAMKLLHEYQLDAAEQMFLQIYHDQNDTSNGGRVCIQALFGLSDICSRKHRWCRLNPLESQWLQIHAVALLQHAINLCENEVIAENADNWYRENVDAGRKKLVPLEDSLIRSLYKHIHSQALECNQNHYHGYEGSMNYITSAPTTPTFYHDGSYFPLSVDLKSPLNQMFPAMDFKRATSLESIKETVPSGLQWLLNFKKYCENRLYNSNVDEITEKVLVSAADDGGTEVNYDKQLDVMIASDDTMIASCDTILGLDVSQTEFDDQINKLWNLSTPLKCDVPKCDASRNTNGILTDNENCDKYVDGDNGADENVLNGDDSSSETRLSALNECDIMYTLALCLFKLGERFVNADDLTQADILYSQALVIIRPLLNGTVRMSRFYANTLKHLGMTRTKLGRTESGMKMLRKALKLFREISDMDSNVEIALALIEVGNNNTSEKLNTENILDHVVDAVCEAFDKESNEVEGTLYSPVDGVQGLDDSYSSSTTSCGSYNINIPEAICCYTEAIDVLGENSDRNEAHAATYAGALLKLGDCYFMLKDYERSLDCYERALSLFQRGRSSLSQHSHVMCMLGVTCFMLHLYPKAASVYECAYHIMKLAYAGAQPYNIGLLLALLGLATYKLGNYHKCIAWCFRAFEIFLDIFPDSIPNLSKQKLWIVCQTLYTLGNSYNVLNLHFKAIRYLNMGRNYMRVATNTDKRQFMRVLQILGDCFFAQYDYKTALVYYNEALEVGDYPEVQHYMSEPLQASEDAGLHNQLLSRTADAHISMNQYQDAMGYLQDCSTLQDTLEDDMKEDLVTTLNQLGKMHTSYGDLDKAIDSYKESLEICAELQGSGTEMCEVLGQLGSLCNVKSYLEDDLDTELEMTLAAEQYFQEALSVRIHPGVVIKYAQFLYSQANYDDAVYYLQEALKVPTEKDNEITFEGLEKLTLPEALQDDTYCEDEVTLATAPLLHYLLLISHNALGEVAAAEDELIHFMTAVYDVKTNQNSHLLYSLLGHVMLEFTLPLEAADCFATAFHLSEDYHAAMDNYCVCLIVYVVRTLSNAFESLWMAQN